MISRHVKYINLKIQAIEESTNCKMNITWFINKYSKTFNLAIFFEILVSYNKMHAKL